MKELQFQIYPTDIASQIQKDVYMDAPPSTVRAKNYKQPKCPSRGLVKYIVILMYYKYCVSPKRMKYFYAQLSEKHKVAK